MKYVATLVGLFAIFGAAGKAPADITVSDIRINPNLYRAARSSRGVIDRNRVVGIGRVHYNGLPLLSNVYRAPQPRVRVYGPPSSRRVVHTTRPHQDYNPTPHYSVGSVYIADDHTDWWGFLNGRAPVKVDNFRKVDPDGLYQQPRHVHRPW